MTETDIQEVVSHTEGLAEDNDWAFPTAAIAMSAHLDDVETADIIEAHKTETHNIIEDYKQDN